MVTREEIKELNANEKWWMFQGALIYIFVVGFFANLSIISMLFNSIVFFPKKLTQNLDNSSIF